jgi:2'-5' RNA ligase
VSIILPAAATSPAKLRLFVAIPPTKTVLTEIRTTQSELKTLLPHSSVAWTHPSNWHLTLRFLGNVAAVAVPELEQRLQSALAGFGALDLTCECLGCFPDLRSPRVIWAGVHEANDRLQPLHQRIDEAGRDFAEKPAEARFVGHITLGRIKHIKRPDVARLARFVEATENRRFGAWRASEVMLFRSELSAQGAAYHELARVCLA